VKTENGFGIVVDCEGSRVVAKYGWMLLPLVYKTFIVKYNYLMGFKKLSYELVILVICD